MNASTVNRMVKVMLRMSDISSKFRYVSKTNYSEVNTISVNMT